jgi:hypothetical protein
MSVFWGLNCKRHVLHGLAVTPGRDTAEIQFLREAPRDRIGSTVVLRITQEVKPANKQRTHRVYQKA